jgi:hypothetical protein
MLQHGFLFWRCGPTLTFFYIIISKRDVVFAFQLSIIIVIIIMAPVVDYFVNYGPHYDSLLNKPIPEEEYKEVVRAYAFQCSGVPKLKINNNRSRSDCKLFECPSCSWSIKVHRVGTLETAAETAAVDVGQKKKAKKGKEKKDSRPFCLRSLGDVTNKGVHFTTCPASTVHRSENNTLPQSADFQNISGKSTREVTRQGLQNSGEEKKENDEIRRNAYTLAQGQSAREVRQGLQNSAQEKKKNVGEIESDKALIKELVDKAKSDKLKDHLQQFLAEQKENDEIESDKALIKKLMHKAQSDKLKDNLQQFLADPTNNKKRKRESKKGRQAGV